MFVYGSEASDSLAFSYVAHLCIDFSLPKLYAFVAFIVGYYVVGFI